MPILFATSLPIGLASHQNARCCMEALIGYLTFQYFMNTILSQWGTFFNVDFSAETGSVSGLTTIAGIKTFDMGMLGALLISGIALALYATAKPERRKELLGLMVPVTLTAILCGVTEPIEYTFLFIAPTLFLVHALLAATLSTCIVASGCVGVFAGGLIEMASYNFIPLWASHWKQYLIAFAIGLVFTVIYFFVFRFLILKFDYKTPGREDDEEDVEFKSKQQYREAKAAEKGTSKNAVLATNILDLLGGADNIVDVTNCATRLRVNVKNEALVADDADFKKIGTSGVSKNGKSAQVIVGLTVAQVRDEFEKLL